MRFGNTSAVVRVGRDTSPSLPLPGYRPAAPAALRGPAPAAVRVGRTQQAPQTRTGQVDPAAAAANTPTGLPPGFSNIPLVGCAAQYDWTNSCVRTLGTGRVSIAAGATTAMNVTTCGPARVLCIVVPESFALLFEITQIQICRDNFIITPIPAEALSDQGDYACLGLGCGAVFFSSQPMVISAHNISGAAAFFSAMVVVQEMNLC